MSETPHPSGAPHNRGLGPTLIVLVITLITGAVYGRLTQRWGPTEDLVKAAAHLQTFPHQFGDWQEVSQEPLDDATSRMLSCAGYINRKYINRHSGETVSVAILLGPAGPISVHTPEVCYSSRAYSLQGPAKEVSVTDDTGKKHTFWSVSFRSGRPDADQLRVWYAWRGEKGWEASTAPRFEFAALPALYKIQLATLVPGQRGAQTQEPRDACVDFMNAMLRSGWKVARDHPTNKE